MTTAFLGAIIQIEDISFHFANSLFTPSPWLANLRIAHAVSGARQNLSGQFACATSPKEVSNMSKRFTALLMALVLVVGVLAVPASAATGEIIQPQSIPGCQCAPPNVVTRWDEANYSVRLTTCYFAMPNCRGDYAAMKYEGQKCTKCGHSTNRKPVESGGFCPVVGNYKYPSIGRGVSVGLSATVLS